MRLRLNCPQRQHWYTRHGLLCWGGCLLWSWKRPLLRSRILTSRHLVAHSRVFSSQVPEVFSCMCDLQVRVLLWLQSPEGMGISNMMVHDIHMNLERALCPLDRTCLLLFSLLQKHRNGEWYHVQNINVVVQASNQVGHTCMVKMALYYLYGKDGPILPIW